MSTQTTIFNPLRIAKGEFCISLNLTALGDAAWDVLAQAKAIGFPKPTFQSFQSSEGAQVWAVLVEEHRDFERDSIAVLLERWEPMLDQLDLGDRNVTLLIVGRFKQDPIAA
jgi:hypothetical protein